MSPSAAVPIMPVPAMVRIRCGAPCNPNADVAVTSSAPDWRNSRRVGLRHPIICDSSCRIDETDVQGNKENTDDATGSQQEDGGGILREGDQRKIFRCRIKIPWIQVYA